MNFDITTTVTVSSAVVAVIVGFVQLLKGWLKEHIDGLAEKKKKFLDRLWVAIVGVLAIGAGCAVTGMAGWPWWAAFLSSIAYFVAAQGSYNTVRAALPDKEGGA